MGKTTVFSYDKNGNILSKREYAFTLQDEDGLAERPCAEKLYTYYGVKLMSYGGLDCAYDETGVPTRYKGKTVYRNSQGLIQGVGNSSYYYDPLGTLAGAYDYDTGISYSLRYDSMGRVVAMGLSDVILTFLYDHTGVLACLRGEETYLYQKDAQGNIRALLDRDGNVVVQYAYDAWGNHKVLDKDGGTVTDPDHIGHQNPFRYRGYFYESVAGLYYLKSRYYDPETGRFLTPDSIEYLDPDTIGGLNLYAYCNNNPVMFSDPEGHMVITTSLILLVAGLGAIVGAVAGGVYGGIVANATEQSISGGIALGALGGAIMGAGAGVGTLLMAPAISLTATVGVASVTMNSLLSFAVGTAVAFGTGAGAGAITEMMSQKWNNGKVHNWRSVGHSALQWAEAKESA